jgi:hypothetical protein
LKIIPRCDHVLHTPTEPDCNLWKFLYNFLFNAKAEEFFNWRLGRKLFCIWFFLYRIRRGGLDYICCKYEQPSQLIYFLCSTTWTLKFIVVHWYLNVPGCS